MNKKHHLKLRGKKPFNIMSPSYQNGKCSCMRKKILNQYSTYQSFLSSLQHKELEYSYDFWFEGGQHITDSSSREVIFHKTFIMYKCMLFLFHFLSQRWKLFLQHINNKKNHICSFILDTLCWWTAPMSTSTPMMVGWSALLNIREWGQIYWIIKQYLWVMTQ